MKRRSEFLLLVIVMQCLLGDPSQLDYSSLITVGVGGGGGGRGGFRFGMQYTSCSRHAVDTRCLAGQVNEIQLTCNCDQRYDEVIGMEKKRRKKMWKREDRTWIETFCVAAGSDDGTTPGTSVLFLYQCMCPLRVWPSPRDLPLYRPYIHIIYCQPGAQMRHLATNTHSVNCIGLIY